MNPHLVFTDPRGEIVKFTREFHSLVARHINAAHGDFESLWSRQQTDRVEIGEPSDIIGKIAYTMANPVAAFQLRHGGSWPWVRTAWPARPRRIKRPRGFLRPRSDGGRWPADVVLELHRPPRFEDVSDEELARASARRSPRANRRSRSSSAPTGSGTRALARSPGRRAELLARRRAWLDEYAEALERWRAGDRDVVCPHGTYKMRVVQQVNVAPAPA